MSVALTPRAAAAPSLPEITIQPRRGLLRLDVAELWRFRDLWRLLIWRDVIVRYKQTAAGLGWAIVQPLVTMVIFSIVFGRLAHLPSNGVPYPVFAFCALLPWNYFARSMSGAGQSLVRSAGLVTKVYFPRLILPLADVCVGLVDFGIAFVMLLALMLVYGVAPTFGVLLLPALMLLAVATALGVGLWLTALSVKYRDVVHVTPFLVQAWMWLSPVVYPSSMIPAPWRMVYGLNPMVGVIEGFRWALLGGVGGIESFGGLVLNASALGRPAATVSPPDWGMMLASVGVTAVLLVTGLIYFTRTEETFADVI